MGEKPAFVKYQIDSLADVDHVTAGLAAQTSRAGELAKAALERKVAASLSGDLVASAQADADLADTLNALEGYLAAKMEILEFVASQSEGEG